MYTIDASIWINSFDQQERGHETSRHLLMVLGQQGIQISAPYLLLPEVSGAISRTRKNAEQAQDFAFMLTQLPNLTFLAFDELLGEQALQLAAKHKLRGADAVYAAVALKTNHILVSLDNEHLSRLTNVLTVLTPAEVLQTLSA